MCRNSNGRTNWCTDLKFGMSVKWKTTLRKKGINLVSLHYKTRIGRSTSPAGNDCLDPYFGLSCVIPYFGKSRVAACFGITCQAVINLPCHSYYRDRVWHGIFWEMPCGSLFRYYLPGGYIFNCIIAITETWCDTGYFGKSCVAACFSITCQAVIYSTVS